jgi:hypothetical protein
MSNVAQCCSLWQVGLLPANRNVIAEAEGISSLVAMLASPVVGTPETAARALASLARDHATTPDDGGAPPEAETGADAILGNEAADSVHGRPNSPTGGSLKTPEKPGAVRRHLIAQVC